MRSKFVRKRLNAVTVLASFLFFFVSFSAFIIRKKTAAFPELWVGSGDVSSIKVGIFVQVGNWDLWDELASSCIDNVFSSTSVKFLLVSSHEGNHEAVQERYPIAEMVIVPNFGADIAAFFIQLAYLGKRIDGADYVLKIHTESRDWWRRGMLEPICGKAVNVQRAITSLHQSPRVGVLGAQKYAYFVDGNDEELLSHTLARQFDFDVTFYSWYDAIPSSVKYDPVVYRNWPANFDLRHMSSKDLESHYRAYGRKERRVFSQDVIKYLKATSYPRFNAGTCAWFRVPPLSGFLALHPPEIIAQSLLSEVGYFTDDDRDRFTHSWERALSLVIFERGYVTVGI